MPAFLHRLLCVLLLAGSAAVCLGQARESDLKAVYLFNFSQFVEWPVQAFQHTNAPFVYGVMGSPELQAALVQATRGEQLRGHPIEVRAVRSVAEARQAHILFIDGSEAERWPEFRRNLRRLPILTVSDTGRFARQGGMLEFFRSENRVRIRANPAEAKAAGLGISSKLLQLAEIVETEAGHR